MAQKRCFGCMQLKENSPVCEHCGFNEYAQNESHQLPLGTVLRQQYMVGKALGQGGFGITYLGWDLNLDIPIAIKEYYPNSIVNRDATHNPALTGVASNMTELYISTRQRFLREAKVLAKLRNVPNIVQVHNFFEENNTAYIIMEYVKGIDLRRYMNLRGGRLSVEETLTILKPVMQALSRVHEFEIVHRDISPDNIMMMPDGTAKLLDFGAVRNVENADTEKELQQSTEAILKHGFAPMEQYQKRGALGPWTDEYAMCATIYYCLTGRVPPDAPQRMMEDVHPAWEKIPGLTARQIQILEKGMALRAKDRFASISELMQALYAAPTPAPVFEPEPIQVTKPVAPIAPEPELEEPVYTAPIVTRPLDPPDEVLQRKKPVGLIAALALVAVLLVAGFVALGILPKPEVHEPPAAEAPVITTKAPETTAPPVTTTEAMETTAPPVTTTEAPEIDSDAWKDNVLMAQTDGGRATASSPVFGTPITRGSVKSITFLDTLKDAPKANIWDVSEAQDGSVMAWAYQSGDKYDMYIAAEGGINAKNCAYMFSYFTGLSIIDFGNSFRTDQAVGMPFMFNHCDQLRQIDVSTFNTSKVKNMDAMFESCAVQKLDLSSWDTSEVTNIASLVSNCGKLTEIDLTGWNTSKVTNMSWMFWNCGALTDLDMSGWDVSKVENYENFSNYDITINGKPWIEFFQ